MRLPKRAIDSFPLTSHNNNHNFDVHGAYLTRSGNFIGYVANDTYWAQRCDVPPTKGTIVLSLLRASRSSTFLNPAAHKSFILTSTQLPLVAVSNFKSVQS